MDQPSNLLVRANLFAVLAIYSQTGGKNGMHAWQSDSTSIGAVSYLAMQTYEYAYHRNFRGVHQSNAVLQVFSFALVPSDCFLRRLNGACHLSLDGRTLTLQDTDTQLFHQLNVKLQDILKAIKALASARRKS